LEPEDPDYLPLPQSEQSSSASIPGEVEYLPVFYNDFIISRYSPGMWRYLIKIE